MTPCTPLSYDRGSLQAGLGRRPARCWRLRAFASAAPRPACEQQPVVQQPSSRRALLAGAACLSASLLLQQQQARAEGGTGLVEYTDAPDKFTIAVPGDWSSGEGDLSPNANRFSNTAGQSRVVAFAPAGRSDVSVSVAVTNLGPDYTSLGSFGTAQVFGENLVGSMDRSYLLRGPAFMRGREGPVQTAKLLGAKETNGMYYIDYTVNKADEPGRVISTVVAIGNNGRLNRFYTVNATCNEGDVAEYGDLLKQVVSSFRAPRARS